MIQAFKNLTKNFNILSNAEADPDANIDAVVIAIDLPVLSYRRAKKVCWTIHLCFNYHHFVFRGARWLSGRVSDSGARGPGFETYRRRVVSLSKTLYSPKVLVNYPGSYWDVKPQHNQPTILFLNIEIMCCNESFKITTYLKNKYSEVEMFMIKQKSSKNTDLCEVATTNCNYWFLRVSQH